MIFIIDSLGGSPSHVMSCSELRDLLNILPVQLIMQYSNTVNTNYYSRPQAEQIALVKAKTNELLSAVDLSAQELSILTVIANNGDAGALCIISTLAG